MKRFECVRFRVRIETNPLNILDMMRRDSACPATEADALKLRTMSLARPPWEIVEFRRFYLVGSERMPNVARWHSFSCTVTEVQNKRGEWEAV